MAPNSGNRNGSYVDSGVYYKPEANAGSGDGINAVLVTENWYLSTIYNGNLNYNILNPYLSDSKNLAQIRSDNGNVTIRLTNNNNVAINKGAKIVAGGDINFLATGINFVNSSIDVFNRKPYKLRYLLLSDKDNRYSIAYKLSASGAGDLIRDNIDSDGAYERTNNYRDAFKDESNIKFIDYHGNGNAQREFRAVLNTNNFAPFAEDNGDYIKSEAQAIISAGGKLKVEANKLVNSAYSTVDTGKKVDTSNIDKDCKSNCGISSNPVNTLTKDSKEGSTQSTTLDLDASTKINDSDTVSAKVENKGNSTIDDSVDSKATDFKEGSINSTVENEEDTEVQEGNIDNVLINTDDKSVTEDLGDTGVKSVENNIDVDENGKSDSVKVEVAAPIVPTERKVNNEYPMESIPKVNITLPSATDLYGKYIQTTNPKADYLIETNPLYGLGADVLGSDYLREQLRIVPDATVKRLGDSRYEQELVRQQLEQVTGKGTISDKKMEQYFNNAVEIGKDLGFEYGKPLTSDQIKRLDKDIVWMVEQVVNGQRVLVPQVYLSYKTLQNLNSSGSVLEGEEGVDLDVDSLENNESTITGGNVNINAKKDIDNIGATIKGRNVQLKSEEGSINNITVAKNYGDSHSGSTYIGPTASISSENVLILDAAQDINITGAKVSAGGDAVFNAGNDINITTIQDKNASTTQSGKTSTNVQTTTHIGSQIDIGGSAFLKSGNDTLISGSEFNVGGGFAAVTGGDFKLESVQDTVETNTKSQKSGFGVGGGLWGSQTTETNEFIGTNKASTLNVGGAVDILAANKVVIEGSDINIGSEGVSRISGVKGVDILDGKDEYRSQTTTTTTTFLKLEGGDTGAKAGASSNASHGTLTAEAGANAEASANASGSLKLMEQSVEVQTDTEKNSVASKINSKGSLVITSAEGDVHIRGSEVDVAKALAVTGVNVILEAGKNEKTSTNNKDSKSIGLYGEASASANASANANAGPTGASASAEANAEVDGTLTFGAKKESSYTSTTEIKHSKVKLNAGTDMLIDAENTLLAQGVSAKAGGDMTLQATDIINRVVTDSKETTTSNSSTLVGLYIGATASASASGNIGASANDSTGLLPVPSASAGIEGGVSAGVEVAAGLRTLNTSDSSYSLDTTNHGNDFSAGGNMQRNAANNIVDAATNIDVGGAYKQTATNVIDEVVQDQSIRQSTSSSQDVRIGAYVGAGYEASIEQSTSLTPFGQSSTNEKSSEANGWSGGVQASYEGGSSASDVRKSTAVITKINARTIESDVSNHMESNGASYTATDSVTLNAKSATFNEAINTSYSNTAENSLDAKVKVGLVPNNPSLEAGFAQASDSELKSTTTGTGTTISGSKVSINITDKMEDTGLNIDANERSINSGERKTNENTRSEVNKSISNKLEVGLKLSSEGGELNISK